VKFYHGPSFPEFSVLEDLGEMGVPEVRDEVLFRGTVLATHLQYYSGYARIHSAGPYTDRSLMSHFTVLVIASGNDTDAGVAEAYLEEVMEPFSEHLRVPDYDKECYCVGREASNDAAIATQTHFGGDFATVIRKPFQARVERIASMDGEFQAMTKRMDAGELSEQEDLDFRYQGAAQAAERAGVTWDGALKGWRDYVEAAREAHPLHEKPEPTCGTYQDPNTLPDGKKIGDRLYYEDGSAEGCGGTGVTTSTYNPQSQWDWYTIGGRWSGMFSDYDPSTDPRNLETCTRCSGSGFDPHALEEKCPKCEGTKTTEKWSNAPQPEANILPMETIRKKFLSDKGQFHTYALLTPEGEWVEQGQMGWFGQSSGDMTPEEWETEYEKHLDKWADDHIGILVDYHI